LRETPSTPVGAYGLVTFRRRAARLDLPVALYEDQRTAYAADGAAYGRVIARTSLRPPLRQKKNAAAALSARNSAQPAVVSGACSSLARPWAALADPALAPAGAGRLEESTFVDRGAHSGRIVASSFLRA
jgi:hypothetical protein